MDAIRSIVREEGWRALYAGITPALIGSGVAWGIYFFAYNTAKDRYKRLTGQTNVGPLLHLASAAEAGSLVCFVTNPIWVVKTRLQLQRTQLQHPTSFQTAQQQNTVSKSATAALSFNNQAANSTPAVAKEVASTAMKTPIPSPQSIPRPIQPHYTGFLDCLTQIAHKEGLRGLYKGLLPSLFLVSHGAIQFAVYEELKSAAFHLRDFITPLPPTKPFPNKRTPSSTSHNNINSSKSSRSSKRDTSSNGRSQHHELSPVEITACGALSKLAASVATYPSQVIRSRLQQRMDARTLKYTGVLNVLRTTVTREGVGGLYKGLLPNVLRVMPQSALTFLVYESVMKQLKASSVSGDERK